MIIRKPTKIELKVENDQQDYDSFKERLNNERMRNNRQNLVRRDESLFSELLASDRLGNRSYNFGLRAINDLSRLKLPDFMTPQGQGEMRRNIYPPSGERYGRPEAATEKTTTSTRTATTGSSRTCCGAWAATRTPAEGTIIKLILQDSLQTNGAERVSGERADNVQGLQHDHRAVRGRQIHEFAVLLTARYPHTEPPPRLHPATDQQ